MCADLDAVGVALEQPDAALVDAPGPGVDEAHALRFGLGEHGVERRLVRIAAVDHDDLVRREVEVG